jgi:crotonobetainyl-CoA:carnitine CoA-transferase CaiB-like acyl-CoA transferase
MDRLGLGHAALLTRSRRLVVCALSGFRADRGPIGACRARSGVRGAGRAAGDGRPGRARRPCRGRRVADVGGAWVAVSGVLAALSSERRRGRGRLVDVSLAESATSFAALTSDRRCSASRSRRRGRACWTEGFRRTGLYRTGGRPLARVAALEPKFFEALCVPARPREISPRRHTAVVRERSACGACWRGPFARRSLATGRSAGGLDACVEPVLVPEEVRATRTSVAGPVSPPGVLATPLHLGPRRPRPRRAREHTRGGAARPGSRRPRIDALLSEPASERLETREARHETSSGPAGCVMIQMVTKTRARDAWTRSLPAGAPSEVCSGRIGRGLARRDHGPRSCAGRVPYH